MLMYAHYVGVDIARKLIQIAWACVTKQRFFDSDFTKLKQVA